MGKRVVDPEGDICTVENIYFEIVESPETVYNFQVEDYHTYHVGHIGVLVHNKNFENGRGVIEEAVESGSEINKPYANSRLSYGKDQVEQVWENAKNPTTG